MEEGVDELRVERSNREFEVGDELALVTPLVLDHAPVVSDAQVVHHELPLAAEIAAGERHLRIHRTGV